MSLANRMNHKARELRGRFKRTVGVITGDSRLEAEGMAEGVVGKLGQTDEKIKDAFRGRRPRRRRGW